MEEVEIVEDIDEEKPKRGLSKNVGVPKSWRKLYDKILVLYSEGKSVEEIGKKVRRNVSQVYRITRMDLFQDRLRKIKEESAGIVQAEIMNSVKADARAIQNTAEIITDAVPMAAKKLVKLMKRGLPEERIQLDAAKEILHMSGFKPVEVVETRKREYTPEELEGARRTMVEMEHMFTRLNKSESSFVISREIN